MCGLLIFTPLARGTTRIWALSIMLSASYLAIFLWFFRRTNSPAVSPLTKTKLDKAVIIFSFLAVVSFILSCYKHDSLLALLRLFAYIGIYYLLINNFDENMFRKLLFTAVFIGTSLSVYGLLQYFGFLGHAWWYPYNFLAASYVNHSHFAGYLALVIPLTVGCIIKKHFYGKDLSLLFITALIIMAAAFILTQSRGAWFALSLSIITVSMLALRNKPDLRKGIVTIAILIVIAISLIYFSRAIMIDRINTLSEESRVRENSFATRLKIWQGSLEMIRERPLVGFGIGNFDNGFYRYRPERLNRRAVYAHNEYLHMAAEMGILSIPLILWIFVSIISSGIRVSSNPVAFGCTIGALSLILHGLVDFNFHIPANMLLFIVTLSYIMYCKSRIKD